ncbi:hypothetical protein KIPB_013409, partial [Kipferlia bialata]
PSVPSQALPVTLLKAKPQKRGLFSRDKKPVVAPPTPVSDPDRELGIMPEFPLEPSASLFCSGLGPSSSDRGSGNVAAGQTMCVVSERQGVALYETALRGWLVVPSEGLMMGELERERERETRSGGRRYSNPGIGLSSSGGADTYKEPLGAVACTFIRHDSGTQSEADGEGCTGEMTCLLVRAVVIDRDREAGRIRARVSGSGSGSNSRPASGVSSPLGEGAESDPSRRQSASFASRRQSRRLSVPSALRGDMGRGGRDRDVVVRLACMSCRRTVSNGTRVLWSV